MSAHDQIANKEYSSPPVAVNGVDSGSVYADEQALRVVYIEKKSDPLVCVLTGLSDFKVYAKV